MTRILGIETSCDETSAAVLEGTGNDVIQKSLVILSQDVHRVFCTVLAFNPENGRVIPAGQQHFDHRGIDEIRENRWSNQVQLRRIHGRLSVLRGKDDISRLKQLV